MKEKEEGKENTEAWKGWTTMFGRDSHQ